MLKELKAKLIRLSNTKIQNACSRWEKPSFSRKRSRRRGGRAAASHRFCKNSSFWRQHIINNVRGHERGLRFFCCKKKMWRGSLKKGLEELRTKPAFVQIHFSWYWQFEAFANAEAVSEATASASLESFQVQKWKQPQGWSAVRAASGWVEPPGSACGKKAHKWRRPRNEDTNPHTHTQLLLLYLYKKLSTASEK